MVTLGNYVATQNHPIVVIFLAVSLQNQTCENRKYQRAICISPTGNKVKRVSTNGIFD